jgi:aconitate hydratase 2/2-methylisocitrate dehydratase
MTNIGHFRAAGKVLEGKSDIPTRLWIARRPRWTP